MHATRKYSLDLLAATVTALLAACLLCATDGAFAATFPDGKPVRIVVPFAPGGTADNAARIISEKLSRELNTPVVIDNKPGANGMIGTQVVASSKPDGHTLLITPQGSHTVASLLQPGSPDPVKDFAPVTLISRVGFLVVVNANHPAKTFQQFVEYARTNQKKLSISSSSSGVTLMAEALKRNLGFPEAVIANYKGGPYQAVLTGETDMTLDAFNSIALIKAGKLRALAIMTPQRSPDLPNVPTLDELGHKGLHFSSWSGLLAPAATPKDIVDRLHVATKSVLADPTVVRQFYELSQDVVAGPPTDFRNEIRSDVQRWRELIRGTGYIPN